MKHLQTLQMYGFIKFMDMMDLIGGCSYWGPSGDGRISGNWIQGAVLLDYIFNSLLV